jgi:hypothetical protein
MLTYGKYGRIIMKIAVLMALLAMSTPVIAQDGNTMGTVERISLQEFDSIFGLADESEINVCTDIASANRAVIEITNDGRPESVQRILRKTGCDLGLIQNVTVTQTYLMGGHEELDYEDGYPIAMGVVSMQVRTSTGRIVSGVYFFQI